MSRYPLVTLGDVLTRSTEVVAIEPEQRYQQVTVRMWGKGVVQRDEVFGAEIASGQRFSVRTDQFLVSRIDARHGATGIVPPELDGAVVTNDFPAYNVDTTVLQPAYLGWLSRTRDFVETCRRASEGSTNRVRLKEESFLSSEFALPPLPEQRRLVARIEAVAAKVAEAQQLREEQLMGSGNLIESLHLRLAGDRVVELGDIVRLDEEKVTIEPGKQYPQVGVKGFGQGLFAREAVDATQTTYRSFNRLYAGMLVLSQVKGWEGAIGVLPTHLAGRYASPEYRTFTCRDDQTLPEYLARLVATPWFYSKLADITRGVGARRERTRPEQFLKLRLAMPDVAAQQYAVGVFALIEASRALRHATLPSLDGIMPAVLDRAFRGEW